MRKLTANDWLARAAQVTAIAAQAMVAPGPRDRLRLRPQRPEPRAPARAEDIAFVALDNDPQRVREAAGGGASVVYGDAGRRETLVAAGLAKARARRRSRSPTRRSR